MREPASSSHNGNGELVPGTSAHQHMWWNGSLHCSGDVQVQSSKLWSPVGVDCRSPACGAAAACRRPPACYQSGVRFAAKVRHGGMVLARVLASGQERRRLAILPLLPPPPAAGRHPRPCANPHWVRACFTVLRLRSPSTGGSNALLFAFAWCRLDLE